MRRTIILLVVEAIVIVGLLVPAMALANFDIGGSSAGPPALEQQVQNLALRLDQTAVKVAHVHNDAHNALNTPADNVNRPNTGPTLPPDPWMSNQGSGGTAVSSPSGLIYEGMGLGMTATGTTLP